MSDPADELTAETERLGLYPDTAASEHVSKPRCRFDGHAAATVRAQLTAGCVCYPDDREQYLCEQHWHQMEPLGDARVVEELT